MNLLSVLLDEVFSLILAHGRHLSGSLLLLSKDRLLLCSGKITDGTNFVTGVCLSLCLIRLVSLWTRIIVVLLLGR
jgi:hypothetical protein